jgi:hypothetical protein
MLVMLLARLDADDNVNETMLITKLDAGYVD